MRSHSVEEFAIAARSWANWCKVTRGHIPRIAKIYNGALKQTQANTDTQREAAFWVARTHTLTHAGTISVCRGSARDNICVIHSVYANEYVHIHVLYRLCCISKHITWSATLGIKITMIWKIDAEWYDFISVILFCSSLTVQQCNARLHGLQFA